MKRERKNAFFESLFRTSPSPFLIVKPDSPRFTIIDANDAYLDAVMRKRDELIGHGIAEAFCDSRDQSSIGGISTLIASFGRVLATRQPDCVTGSRCDVSHPDGALEKRWWSLVNTAMLDENGEVEAIFHNANDVTKQFRAEARFRQSEERLELALQATDLAVYEWNLVTDRLTANERFRKMFGIGPGEAAVGAHLMAHCVHPDDRTWVDAYLARAMDPMSSGHFIFEFRLNRTDHRGEIWVLSHGRVYFDGPCGSSSPARVFGTLQDITARKHVELKLRDAEARQRHLIESWVQAIWETDATGLVVEDSPSWRAYTGQTLEEWLGYGWLDAIHPEDRAYAERQWNEAVEVKGFVNAEFRLRAPDGGWRWTNVRAAPLLDEKGNIEKWAGMNIDISEQVQARLTIAESEQKHLALSKSLQMADERKNEFLATLAHELRNPLAPLRTGLSILDRSDYSSSTAVRTREVMHRQLTHMVRLIDDLLDMSRVRQGKIALKMSIHSLQSLVELALETFRPVLDAAGQQLHVDLPSEPVLLTVDATRIAQVLTNILNNASKFSPDGSELFLHAECVAPDRVRLQIEDDGIGMPPDMLEGVFDLFTQVRQDGAQSKGGLGIGLSLSRRLIELHGGTVWASSGGLGQGSTFTVELPAMLGQSNSTELSGSNNVEPILKVDHRSVLVVDDNVDVAIVLAMALELDGHTVRTVHSGNDAINAYDDGIAPDFIFLDIGLPDLSGYEVAAQLRQRRAFDRTVIVALTGWGSERDKQHSTEVGFDLHLTKPVAPDELRDVMKILRQ